MNKTITSVIHRDRRFIAEPTGHLPALYTLMVALVGIALLLLLPYFRSNAAVSEMDSRFAKSAATSEQKEVARLLPLPHEVVAGCVVLAGVVICIFERRSRRAPTKYGRRRGDLLESGPAPYDESSRSRLAQKRLKILGTLVNDNHKLLPSDLTVGDLMTTVVRTARPATPIAELRAMTIEFKIRHILVCNDDNELVGVVSDRDLRRVSGKLVASDLMAECPTTVTSDTLVNQAITVLLYGHISSLPVVDAGRLVGIITTTDVVMTLQCAMLAVEQMVRELGAGNRPASAPYSEV